MARKHQQKYGIAYPDIQNNDHFVKAAIVKVDSKDPSKIEFSPDEDSVFLLNPSSWEENNAVNWSLHNVPGQSDPILQWVSGSARTVSFDALVTRDTYDFNTSTRNPLDSIAEAAVNAVGSLASNFFGVNVPNLTGFFGATQGEGEDLSIAKILAYYRSLLYPNYSQDGILVNSPKLVRLYVGKTYKQELWVVSNLRIKITKQLPNLTPMEAVVSFQLIEYSTKSKSSVDFTGDPPSASPSAASNFIKSLF